jgi:L-ascorbate metabolism protein UlaG (beta-lactamase superfamily)
VLRCGAWTIYHSGDTIAFDGIGESLRDLALDLAILPINGKLGNMNGIEAARVASTAGAKLARILRAGERLTLERPRSE